MTTITESQAEQLRNLKREAEQWNRGAGRRWVIGTILMVAMVLFTAGYLWFAHDKISQVEPQHVVLMIEEQLRPVVIDVPQEQITDQFRALAPTVGEKVEEALRQAPEAAEQQIQAHLDRQLDQFVQEFEQTLALTFKATLLAARDRAVAEGRSLDDPAEAEALMAEMAQVLSEEMRKAVDEFYLDYSTKARGFIDYMDRLANKEGLTEQEKLHRDMLLTLFALVQKYHNEGAPPLMPEGIPTALPIQG